VLGLLELSIHFQHTFLMQHEMLMFILYLYLFSVGMTPNLPSPGNVQNQQNLFAAAAAAGGSANAHVLGALASQHRLLELSRFGLRGYDLAQHMLTQQGAVSKLLGE
jgi:hypothetical protein